MPWEYAQKIYVPQNKRPARLPSKKNSLIFPDHPPDLDILYNG